MDQSDPDAAFALRARGDSGTFACLYERYADPVYCYRRLGTREAAEDATSQVFTQALAALPRFRGGSVPSWLFTIAHNAVINAARRAPPDPFDGTDTIADASQSPEDTAVAAEAQDTLRALLRGLPDDQQCVVELRLAGLSGAEIAAAMERSLAAVKMLQVRALKRMRLAATSMEDHDGDR